MAMWTSNCSLWSQTNSTDSASVHSITVAPRSQIPLTTRVMARGVVRLATSEKLSTGGVVSLTMDSVYSSTWSRA